MTNPPHDQPPGPTADERLKNLPEDRRQLVAELLKQARAARSPGATESAPPPPPSPPPPASSGEAHRAAPPPPGASPPHVNPFVQQWMGAQQAWSEARRTFFEGLGGHPGFGGIPGASTGGPRPPGASPLVALKPSGSLPPLFLAAPMFGSTFTYHLLALHLPAEQPVYGLQSPALDGQTPAQETIPELARDYVAALKQVQRAGPYYLGGHSFGGWVAFEMAHQLLAAGERVAFLGIIGATLPPSMTSPMQAKALEYAWGLVDDHTRLQRDASLTDAQRVAFRGAESMVGTPLQRIAAANLRASLRYVPRPIEQDLCLLVTMDLLCTSPGDRTLGWELLSTRTVDMEMHDGNHISCFAEPHVRDLANKLSVMLAKAQRR